MIIFCCYFYSKRIDFANVWLRLKIEAPYTFVRRKFCSVFKGLPSSSKRLLFAFDNYLILSDFELKIKNFFRVFFMNETDEQSNLIFDNEK